MSKKYTAAIIGCGSIGHAHMDGYNLVDNIDVIAVADPTEIARQQYVEEYDIPQQFDTVEEMLEKAKKGQGKIRLELDCGKYLTREGVGSHSLIIKINKKY